eukprot:6214740-Pleurochrysis_carterae.AAC.2
MLHYYRSCFARLTVRRMLPCRCNKCPETTQFMQHRLAALITLFASLIWCKDKTHFTRALKSFTKLGWLDPNDA